MAFIQCNIQSAVLGKSVPLNLLLPQCFKNGVPDERREFRVLYLLHGLSDDCSMWMRRTSIERYMAAYGDVAVVMPDGGRSFYTDMKHGPKYWTFISEELPAIVRQLFPVSSRREDTFVAGFSMGGYGTLKLALSHPERFAAAGIMSSVTDIAAKFDNPDYAGWQLDEIFGSPAELAPGGNDPFALLEKAAAAPLRPGMIQICGTEDYLWADNVKLRDAFQASGWGNYRFEAHPGAHNWVFWDRHIQTILKFFFE